MTKNFSNSQAYLKQSHYKSNYSDVYDSRTICFFNCSILQSYFIHPTVLKTYGHMLANNEYGIELVIVNCVTACMHYTVVIKAGLHY